MSASYAMLGGTARLVGEHEIAETDGPIHGATFDGHRLVVAAGTRLLRIRPNGGRVVDQLETFPERGGLAYDRGHLWQHGEGRIQQLDPRTGFVTKALSPSLQEMTGLECVGNDLLVLHAGGRALARVETFDGKVVTDVEIREPLRGLAWVGAELWSGRPGQLCRIDPSSGRVVAEAALAPGIGVCDLASDAEGRVWCVDGRSCVVRAFAR